MPRVHSIRKLATLLAVVLSAGVAGEAARAAETPAGFDERQVRFRNGEVELAGSLLLPRSGEPVAAVVFIHGAGRQTREPYRVVAGHFARHGIAALIYDKRGIGDSGGTYESYAPYENLVGDALAAVEHLARCPEIAPSKIGVWGLSQGTWIGAEAAARSNRIQFVVAAGASVADGTQFYYRDNLFRRYGLPASLRDVAEKAQLCQDTLPHNWQVGDSFLGSFTPRDFPSPGKFVHPAWSRVRQPVLAMWGQLDQHQPAGESVLGLKHSLALANNDRWTIAVLPKANHDLGKSETGELHRGWHGYAPGALKTMTDWVHAVLERPLEIGLMKQIGSAPETGVLAKAARYERLRWYGNGFVQAALLLFFAAIFVGNTIAGIRGAFTRLFRGMRSAPVSSQDRIRIFKRVLCALNLSILIAMSIVTLLVLDQIRPSCPAALRYLPLAGSLSAIATVVFLTMLALARHAPNRAATGRIAWRLEVACLILFIPYLYYWNAIGIRY